MYFCKVYIKIKKIFIVQQRQPMSLNYYSSSKYARFDARPLFSKSQNTTNVCNRSFEQQIQIKWSRACRLLLKTCVHGKYAHPCCAIKNLRKKELKKDGLRFKCTHDKLARDMYSHTILYKIYLYSYIHIYIV